MRDWLGSIVLRAAGGLFIELSQVILLSCTERDPENHTSTFATTLSAFLNTRNNRGYGTRNRTIADMGDLYTQYKLSGELEQGV